MAITKNIVTDYGADDTGATSVTPAFYTGLKPAMAGQDCNLTIPDNGVGHRTYNFLNTGGAVWASGHTSLNVTATGATLTGDVILGPSNLTPHSGIDDAAGISARIQSVSAGATSVTLTAASASAGHISRANIGRWMMISGFPIQGVFQGAYGFPPNNQFNDHVLITNIVGNTITFTPALQNSYSSAWPEFTRGDRIFEIDGGGPATAYFMHADWGAPIAYTGGTYTSTGNLINVQGRDMTFNGSTFTDFPLYPSLNQTFRLYNSTLSGAQVEADKNNDLVDIQNGTHTQWWWQSSSTRMLAMNGVTVTSAQNGTPRNAVLDNCAFGSLNLGPTSYGRGETAIVRNCTISGNVGGGFLEKGPHELGMQDCMFMSGGLITIPMCIGDIATRAFVPDAAGRNVNFWSGSNGPFKSFQVLSMTADSWPAADNQTATTAVTIANGSKNLSTSTPTFSSGDVGKVIFIPAINDNGYYGDCTISNASPGVVTASNSFVANDTVKFQASGGVLPSQLVAGTTYYVSATGLSGASFSVSATPGGTRINTSGGSGTVQYSIAASAYTFITGFTDSQHVTIFDACTGLGMNGVSRGLQWGTCNVYIQTNESGGLPSSALYGSQLQIKTAPVRSVTFQNCTGSSHVVDLSQTAAQGRPLWSYSKRTYNGLNGADQVTMLGNITSIKINVLTPYTGSASVLLFGFSQFNNMGVTSGGVFSNNFGPRVNLKIAGERVITIGSTTGTQTGDSGLTLSAPTFIGAAYNPYIGNNSPGTPVDISGESSSLWPSFTVEIITDQGFFTGPTAVAPLRLRLRA